MNGAITEMLKRYDGVPDRKNALKEVIQEIVLCGLSRGGFFRKAAFYGGTALRIFYGLDRFSEDLDFSLMTPDPEFALAEYFPSLQNEAAAWGLNVDVGEKEKTSRSAIRSAFVKAGTKEHMLMFYGPDPLTDRIQTNEKIKIKFAIDTDPPGGAAFERKYRLLPAPYETALYDLPSLFAGKVHAVICRAWKSRIKGRDLYDYVFYISRGAALNTEHLKARLVQSGAWDADRAFGAEDAKKLLRARFGSIDYSAAKEDVRPFVRNAAALEVWSADFFMQITDNLR
ncbi:MAG: nucleotidyl transferase AbiEii/AbiGii toxin family protein [Abditibacteriota bacterium]|nr:nucleotidyl transferase AbiEii/AbiGii toxin family protein [Abditibacteriota bacterium]